MYPTRVTVLVSSCFQIVFGLLDAALVLAYFGPELHVLTPLVMLIAGIGGMVAQANPSCKYGVRNVNILVLVLSALGIWAVLNLWSLGDRSFPLLNLLIAAIMLVPCAVNVVALPNLQDRVATASAAT